mmetsp:Transcript_5181/g.5955  ORF Transcript_5181/g.5955 Transcript_5181/m.5955 type:complete len:98 (+) Transcript_5181:117-410(+)
MIDTPTNSEINGHGIGNKNNTHHPFPSSHFHSYVHVHVHVPVQSRVKRIDSIWRKEQTRVFVKSNITIFDSTSTHACVVPGRTRLDSPNPCVCVKNR